MAPRWETILLSADLLFLLLVVRVASCGLLAILELLESGGRLEFRLIHYKEMARSSLGEVRLCQDILHTCDWTHFSLVIDVLELMDIVGLVYDAISTLKVDKAILGEIGGLLVAVVVVVGVGVDLLLQSRLFLVDYGGLALAQFIID